MKIEPTQHLDSDSNTGPVGALNDHDDYPALAYVGVGVILVNRNGKINYFNPAAEEITGLKSKNVMGRQFNHVLGCLSKDRDALNFFALRSIETPAEYDVDIDHQSDKHRQRKIKLVVNRDLGNDWKGYVFTLQDLTQLHRKTQEVQRHRSVKLLADMAARLAHEIRNPLGSIELFASSIAGVTDPHPETKALATYISTSVESINAIIENLIIAVNPTQTPDFNDFDLHETLEDALFFARHLFSSTTSVRVKTRLRRSPLQVKGDYQLLKQVMLNLFLNAIQAMPRGGELTIASQQIQQGQSGRRFAEIRIADTGFGIAAKDLDRVFDPYFTTKADGSGLGLSIVYNILTAHKGTIAIESTFQEGTECIIRIPMIKERTFNAGVKAGSQEPVSILGNELRNQNVRAIHTSN